MFRKVFPAAVALPLVACAFNALAQPPIDADLGRFDDVAFRSVVQSTVVIDAVHPVRWYSITLPRIVNPHRFLDIWTQNQLSFDTEIALYAPDGTLIATDDDDGADNHSALSFGLGDPNAPQRLNPTAFAGQSASLPNDGRDGAFSGPYPTAPFTPGPTAATYYIAVTQYNAIFANNFSVTHVTQPSGIVTSLAVRMNTPAGFTPFGVTPANLSLQYTINSYVVVDSFGPVVSVWGDLRNLGRSGNEHFSGGPHWSSNDFDPPLPYGPRVLPMYAFNAFDDVTLTNVNAVVRPAGYNCFNALNNMLPFTIGTRTVPYTTLHGNVDGPWTNACYSQTPSGSDIWFSLNPSVNVVMTLSTCNADTGFTGSQPDTLLGVRRFCDDNGFFVCADDTPGCGVGTRLSNIALTANEEYLICIRAWGTDIENGLLNVNYRFTCDSIDFNNDTSLFDPQDIEAFLSVYSEGPCVPAFATCNDIDFNNDTSVFDPCDISSFLVMYSEGPCTPCGQ